MLEGVEWQGAEKLDLALSFVKVALQSPYHLICHLIYLTKRILFYIVPQARVEADDVAGGSL